MKTTQTPMNENKVNHFEDQFIFPTLEFVFLFTCLLNKLRVKDRQSISEHGQSVAIVINSTGGQLLHQIFVGFRDGLIQALFVIVLEVKKNNYILLS